MTQGSSTRLGLLFLNPDTNTGEILSNGTNYTSSLPVSIIKKYHFLKVPDSQVRLFGCYGESGFPIDTSIAGQFKDYLGIDSYGFHDSNATGSQGINDKSLGHNDGIFVGPKSRERIGPAPKYPSHDNRPYKYPGDIIAPKNGDTWFVNVAPGKNLIL